jgi:hypothetical protein
MKAMQAWCVLLAAVVLISVFVRQPCRAAEGTKQGAQVIPAGPRGDIEKLEADIDALGKSGDDVHKSGSTGTFGNPVLKALDWLARHQMPDGNWSLAQFATRCSDKTCTGIGGTQRNQDMAATALGLLPLLGAGQTHREGKYKQPVHKGLHWLIEHQKPDGDLRGGDTMYSHGFAALALCEAYGMTKDQIVGAAAQKAIDFIEKAQHKEGGGWRYNPGTPGDTSVFGWQMAALRSAQLAGLNVAPATLDGARKYLKSAASDEQSGQFSYMPAGQPSLSMTAVGLLDSLCLGAKPGDPPIAAGVKVLMKNLPDATEAGHRNAYYWFYATQVAGKVQGEPQRAWNAKLRETLLATQAKEGCAAGSWDPGKPVKETWGEPGGRLMVTSLSTLSLEVYYRFLPIFLDRDKQPPQ